MQSKVKAVSEKFLDFFHILSHNHKLYCILLGVDVTAYRLQFGALYTLVTELFWPKII